MINSIDSISLSSNNVNSSTLEQCKTLDEVTEYQISSFGRLCTPFGKISKAPPKENGYIRPQFRIGGKGINKYMQVLVAKAFIPFLKINNKLIIKME